MHSYAVGDNTQLQPIMIFSPVTNSRHHPLDQDSEEEYSPFSQHLQEPDISDNEVLNGFLQGYNDTNHEEGKSFNPNWHEGGHFPPPCPFWIKFCQLNFYQKFPNFFWR